MPFKEIPPDRLLLWPHRSLSRQGFVWFIAATALLMTVPLLVHLGNPTLWVLLPFAIGAVWGVWFALRKNGRDRDIVEDLRLSHETIVLVRHGPKGKRQEWRADPYWVRVTLHPTGGPVPNYLTLKGQGREVELGAFLSEEERVALGADLKDRLASLR